MQTYVLAGCGVIAAAVVFALVIRLVRRARRNRPCEMDLMEGHAPVGVKAVQEAYAGRDYYDRMVGAVLTNQYFTQPAVEAARKLKILLWDRGYLESMLEE